MEYTNIHLSWHNFVLVLILVVSCNNGLSGTLLLQENYITHEEMTNFLKNISYKYPKLASLYSIGNSTAGKELWVMELTGKTLKDQVKPNVKLVANIHGNEVVGRELLMNFIQFLVTSYNTSNNQQVTQLLDYARVHILPSLNPDGFEIAMKKPKDPNRCTSSPGRSNKNGIDLNRNFPDFFRKNSDPVQAETAAVKNWMDKTPFVLSACLHGGSLVAIYPFDNSAEDRRVPEPSLSPDDDVFRYLAKVYSKTHPTMHKGESCPNMNAKFKDGISNGAAWYTFTGGMQDYNYMKGCMEVTVEVSCCKFPNASKMPQLWDENRDAMLLYLMQVMRGVHGIVTDELGKPISGAVLTIAGRSVPFISSDTGHFWRILLPGEYLLEVGAKNYEKRSVVVTVTGSFNFTDMKSTFVKVKLNRVSNTTTTSTSTTSTTMATVVATNVTPSFHEVKSDTREWKIGESKSGVISKSFHFHVGLLALIVVFFYL